MKIGFGAPVSGVWATPDTLASIAASAEAAGYASLWTFQRLMVPEGSAMEPVYHSVLDPMVALGYLAAVTQRIRLGVAVVNMPYLAPGYLAKMAATADVLSRGRLELGLGIGWLPEEFTLAGGTMARRGARTGEYIEVMRRIWAEGLAEFHGQDYEVPAGWFAPDPVQRPGPPILLGGIARPALERAGGWRTAGSPPAGPTCPGSARGSAWSGSAAAQAGRDPDSIRIICRGVVRAGAPVTVPEGGGRVLLSGSYADIRADVEWLAERGVTEVFYDLNWDPLVGAPDADPVGAVARAEEILTELAPGGQPGR